MRGFLLVGGLALIGFAAGLQRAQPVPYKQVEPVFRTYCAPCHSGARPAHGLTLTSYASIMKGDTKGKVVIPGSPTKSRLATVLHGNPQPMPPGNDVPPAKIALIEAWIKSGSKEK